MFPDDGFWSPAARPRRGQVDQDLGDAVVERLIADPDLIGADIQATVQNQVVIIAGTVPSSRMRAEVINEVWNVTGVFDVCNLLRITGS